MAHFRAVIQGSRGSASRLGSKVSGMVARLQTWEHDLEVTLHHVGPEAAQRDRTLEAGDWAVVEIMPHDACVGRVLVRVNLSTGEVL